MRLIMILIVPFFLYASSYNTLLMDYKQDKFEKACKRGIGLLSAGEKNEEILSLIGDACAKSDYINVLGKIQRYQRETKNSRENASYFSILVLQKRLIMQFMHDNLDLTGLKLPKTDHILSKVFINLANGNFEDIHIAPRKVRIDASGHEYTLYISPTGNKKFYIKDKNSDGKITIHRYQ